MEEFKLYPSIDIVGGKALTALLRNSRELNQKVAI